MTAPTPRDLPMMLNDALANGDGALIILILHDTDGSIVGLKMNSTPISPHTMVDIAEFATERAIAHCALVADGSADAPRRHLADALRSLQAASGLADAPTIGRA